MAPAPCQSCWSNSPSVFVRAVPLNLIVQHMFATLVIQVVELRRDHTALIREVGGGQDFRHVHLDKKTGLVMNHRWTVGGAGEGKKNGEEGGESEHKKFHGIISMSE